MVVCCRLSVVKVILQICKWCHLENCSSVATVLACTACSLRGLFETWTRVNFVVNVRWSTCAAKMVDFTWITLTLSPVFRLVKRLVLDELSCLPTKLPTYLLSFEHTLFNAPRYIKGCNPASLGILRSGCHAPSASWLNSDWLIQGAKRTLTANWLIFACSFYLFNPELSLSTIRAQYWFVGV